MRFFGLALVEHPHTAKWRQILSSPPIHSPDRARLAKYEFQKMFICDELMSDRRDHKYVSECVIYKVVAFTRGTYNFLLSPDGVALPVPDPNGWRIKGELWIVRPQAIWEKLDKLKSNRVQFIRSHIDVLDPFREEVVDDSRYINNRHFDEEGRLLPPVLAGRKGTERYLSEEKIWIQDHVWCYHANPDHWGYQLRRRPELFERVPLFAPKAEKKEWLSEYFKYQSPPRLEDS